MIRQIYSCDWCRVDSDRPGFVGNEWTRIATCERPGDSSETWLCAECVACYRDAVSRARNVRSPT